MKMLLFAYRLYFRLLFLISPRYAARKAFHLFTHPRPQKLRDREKEALSKAEQEDWTLQGQHIRVYRWGNGPRNAVLIHGWEGHAGHFGAIAERLASLGFSVFAMDGPAHGKSEGKQTNIVHFSRTVAELLQKVGKVDVLITHSFGSAATSYALVTHRDIVVNQMIQITSPDRFEDVLRDFTKVLRFSELQYQHYERQIENILHILVSRMQVSQLCSKARVKKALLLHDPHDKVLPFSNAARIAQHWPQAELHPMPGTGHYRILWHEKTLAHIEQFVLEKAWKEK